MRNSWKVAKWEIKRNLKNKTFLIGLFSSPVIIIGFMLISSLFGDSDSEEASSTRVLINDQLNIYENLENTVAERELDWEMELTDLTDSEIKDELENTEDTAYLIIDNNVIDEGVVSVYTSEEIDSFFINQVQLLKAPLQSLQMEQLGLSKEQLEVISRGIVFSEQSLDTGSASQEAEVANGDSDINSMERIVPGAFAGFIMLSIVFTGMAIFQSASQEKKDKIAEIILSSLTPADLMQGKIIGYFVLGIIQSIISIILVLPFLSWRFDLPIIEYLFVPELILLIGIAVLGFLLFAAIFVGIGATMEDISTAGNFQGMVMMLPFLPFIFIGPVFSDPNGLMAQIGTYIPFTSPGVLLLRLSILEEWPWIEIIISLAILVVSVWLFMKLAGKIFKVGILMYGKNATPSEIWKWIRA
ncbi:ABC transporter permease [Aquibacillus rhizosphaerae]|uniref:ABC transporter permease n=1 Tax=Aquibacillus rhizosphaerae TaxID=3051431 RepID=A0ABT7L718_9BACI|nr:ABC transporter permease [Aquibacillus sp. LR5S19]MDL4840385.1 ABC transporter permease [Aquibacillus sp. LR5S19]